MNPLVALITLVLFLVVSAESYLATHAAGIFRMSFLGFGPTELESHCRRRDQSRDVAVVALGSLAHVKLFDVGGSVASIGLLTAFGVAAIRNTKALYIAEPLPTRSTESRAA
jgi:hypothetical protein